MNMKKKIKKEMEKAQERVKEYTKWARMSLRDMMKYLKEEDFANAKIEAEDALERLVWICEELEVLSRLRELLDHKDKDKHES